VRAARRPWLHSGMRQRYPSHFRAVRECRYCDGIHAAQEARLTAGSYLRLTGLGASASGGSSHDQDACPPRRHLSGDAMKAAAAAIQFTDIGPDDPRLADDVLPVLRELRPHLTAESLASIYAEGHLQGLRFTGAYIDSACVGVAGWRIVATTFCGRK